MNRKKDFGRFEKKKKNKALNGKDSFLLLPPSKNPDFYFDEKKERNSILFDFDFFSAESENESDQTRDSRKIEGSQERCGDGRS